MSALRGKYQLGSRIGGGGMAEVFLGTIVGAEGFSRKVAIKRVLAGFSADPKFGQMFVNEARIASLLHHPNIGGVLDFDRDEENRYYLVMELINGVDLRQLEESGRLPVTVAAFVISEVLKGLDYAHTLVHDGRHLKIIHRDVSPHNVMISYNGGVKMVDFGIAKALAATDASRTGSLKGKVAYMSPEQANGVSLDARSDLFAVGVMLHELLTGRRLFSGGTEVEVLARLLTQPISSPAEIDPNIPDDLCQVTMGLLARDRDHRFDNGRAALEALLSCKSASARGGLELRELMRERFPGAAPASAQMQHTPSAMPVVSTPSAPLAAFGATLTAEEDSVSATMPPAATGPTAAGPRAVVPVAAPAAHALPAPSRRGRHSALFLSMVAALCSAAIVGALLVKKSRGDSVAAAAGFDGGVAARAGLSDAAVVARADAAIVAADRPPGAADPDKHGKAGKDSSGQSSRKTSSKPDKPEPKPDKPEPKPDKPEPKPDKPEPKPDKPKPDKPATATVDSKEKGRLRIRVDPWARVSIDGKSYGTTPVNVSLSVGKHRVVLRNEDKDKRDSVTVRIKPGRTSKIERSW